MVPHTQRRQPQIFGQMAGWWCFFPFFGELTAEVGSCYGVSRQRPRCWCLPMLWWVRGSR